MTAKILQKCSKFPQYLSTFSKGAFYMTSINAHGCFWHTVNNSCKSQNRQSGQYLPV